MQNNIEIVWNILQEESRVIKSVVDICHIPCKFIPCDFKGNEEYKNKKTSRDAIII